MIIRFFDNIMPEYKTILKPKSLLCLLLFSLILACSLQVIDAKNVQGWTVIDSYYKVGPDLVKFNEKVLISKGRCSCGLEHEYSLLKVSKFRNYCPYCKKNGVIFYE